MRTKKKKSTRSFTKKKRGGAHGLVLNIMYNKNNEIIDIQTQDILANKDYKDLNYIDPKYHVTDLFKNFSDVFESTHEFFHPSDNPLRSTRKRIVKIAVNNKRDIQLIQITNKIIKALNTFKNRSVRPFIIVRRNGRITPDCEEHFKHTYKLLLRDVADAILEKVGGGGKDFKNVARLMLETPVLVNLMSIKFGLLRRGDMKMEEIRRMFGKTDELVDSLKRKTKSVKTGLWIPSTKLKRLKIAQRLARVLYNRRVIHRRVIHRRVIHRRVIHRRVIHRRVIHRRVIHRQALSNHRAILYRQLLCKVLIAK